MSRLVCLTILGNRNEPLYSCKNPLLRSPDDDNDEKKDNFGFYEQFNKGNNSLNIRHEVCQ